MARDPEITDTCDYWCRNKKEKRSIVAAAKTLGYVYRNVLVEMDLTGTTVATFFPYNKTVHLYLHFDRLDHVTVPIKNQIIADIVEIKLLGT